MRQRTIIEILIILGTIGLIVEIAEGNSWVLIAAGVAAAIWLMARTH